MWLFVNANMDILVLTVVKKNVLELVLEMENVSMELVSANPNIQE
jgi:hypothetical protein